MTKILNPCKEIKEEIFSCDPDYDIIYYYLDNHFDIAASAILNSLLKLFRNTNNINNNKIIKNLINILNNFAKKTKNRELLEKLSNKIDIFLSNISKSLNWKEVIIVQNYISLLVDVQNRCIMSNNRKNHSEKYNFIIYLIFQKRDIDLLNKYMINNMETLLINNNIIPSVFKEIINKFMSIDEDNKIEINYFCQVIYLFLRDRLGDKILSNNDYLQMLKTSDKSFVWDLIHKIENDFNVSREDIASAYGISFYRPNLEEKFEYKENSHLDFTYQDVLTIDNDGDVCLDDGLYIEQLENGTYQLYIHLANVPAIIPYSSYTMREALKKQKTIYLPDTNIPIFEEYLSNGILSILPDKVTNTMTFVIDVDTDYSLILDTLKVVPGKVINKNKLTYKEADDIINNANSPLSERLNLLSEVFKRLSKDNLQVKSFHRFKNILSKRTDTHSFQSDRSVSHLIVEHSMVLSGRIIPLMNKYYNLNLVMPWRVHPKSNDEFTSSLLSGIDGVELNSDILQKIACDYLPKSYYSPVNIGHAGLGIDGYIRVGSSGRRAMDALAEYIIYDLIINRDEGDLDYKYYFWENEINYWCQYANNRIEENGLFEEEYAYLYNRGKILEKK